MDVSFEWDPRKAAKNRQKHDVSFEDAVSVFGAIRISPGQNRASSS